MGLIEIYKSSRHFIFQNILYHAPKKLGRKIFFKLNTGKDLNLKNPQNLNEKINWLIVYEYGKKESILTDKYLVKPIVEKKKIPFLNIPRTYKVYKNANEINLDELPNQFVLKCNHGSGNVFVCNDKDKFDLNEAKIVLNNELKNNYAFESLEYHYKYINPLIIAEEYLNDPKRVVPLDYKVHCFNGKADCIMLCSNRENSVKWNFYDLEWNPLDYTHNENKSNEIFEKPQNLDKMIRIAEELSKDHIFVRVDLYDVNDKVYLGELTFTEQNGIIYFCKDEALEIMGDKLKLPIDD